MSEHPINNMLNSAMDNLKEMVDVNTIVGTPVKCDDGTVVVPVSKVSFGLAAGGSEFVTKKENAENPFGGGVGAGVSITPVAFLVSNQEQVRLLSVQDESDAATKLVDMIPSMVNKIADLFPKKNKEDTIQD